MCLIVYIWSPPIFQKIEIYIESVVLCCRLKHMTRVAEEKKRKPALFTLSPEAKEYVELKAPLFKKGRQGGQSEALNRMILFCRDYEFRMAGKK